MTTTLCGRCLQGLLAFSLLILALGDVTRVSAQTLKQNCRFGMTVPHSLAGYDLSALGVGAYLDWGQTPPTNGPKGLDYIHVIRLRNGQRQFVYDEQFPQGAKAFEESLKSAVRAHPGAIWLVGNEPDTAFESQDGVTPEQYALAYFNIYRLLKESDPGAQIGIGTIVQPTPLRLVWLDKMWVIYQARYGVSPPSDFWSIHSFILREKAGDWGTGIPPGIEVAVGEVYELAQLDDINIFSQRLINFRQWLARRGQRHKPLWITEYGSLLPHDSKSGLVTQPLTRARDYMLATFDFLLKATDEETGYPADGNHLVQRWFWYSLNEDLSRFGGSLYDPATKKRTVIGDAFVEYVAAIPAQPVLRIAQAKVYERVKDETISVRVLLSNSGQAATTKPIRLSWYDGDPRQGGRELAAPFQVSKAVPGCGGEELVVVNLPKPNGDEGKVYLKVESDDLDTPQIVLAGMWKTQSR